MDEDTMDTDAFAPPAKRQKLGDDAPVTLDVGAPAFTALPAVRRCCPPEHG